MRLLQIDVPGLNVPVCYSILSFEEIISLSEELEDSDDITFKKNILKNVIKNLYPEIMNALEDIEEKPRLEGIITELYNGCIMLNPGLDIDHWVALAGATSISSSKETATVRTPRKKKSATSKKSSSPKKISRAKFKGLKPHLMSSIIGQDEAIDTVSDALKRSIAGLKDPDRPIGIFLFAGPSGVGKSTLAKELHSYLFGNDSELVRVDCGEYQHKHENQKLTGSPPGFVGYEEGGQLTNKIINNPRTVILLDEVEKAHIDLWNTFLRAFDEGKLTDNSGKEADLRETIIIMTTNLGNKKIVEDSLHAGLGFNASLTMELKHANMPVRQKVIDQTNKAILKHFTPEFLNRIDKTVVFNHLSDENMLNIAQLEMEKVEKKLTRRGITLDYPADVLEKMVSDGVNSVEGARGLAKVRRDHIENTVADALLEASRWKRGSIITISLDDEGKYVANGKAPE